MFSNKQIFRLTWPILLEQALVSSIFMISTMLVSGVSEYTVSAVGLVDTLNNVVMQFFGAVAVGTTVIISQLTGRRDFDKVRKTMTQSLSLSFLVALVIGLILFIFSRFIFKGLYGSVEEEVTKAGITYLSASGLSYPFIAIYSTVNGIMRSTGDSRTPLIISLVVNLVYVGMGALLILVFRLGINGSSAAIVTARTVGAVLAVILLIYKNGNVVFKRDLFKFSGDVLKPVLSIGVPAAIDSLVFNGGKLLTTSLMSHVATAQLAANNIATAIFNFTSIPGNALNIAVVTIVGQCWGAGKIAEVKKNLLKLTLLGSVTLAVPAAAAALFLPQLITLFKADAAAVVHIKHMLYFSFITQVVLWPAAFILPSGIRSTGDVKYVTTVSVLSMWFLRVAFSLLLGEFFGLGMLGVWIAMSIDWVGRAVFFILRAARGKYFDRHVPAVSSAADGLPPGAD